MVMPIQPDADPDEPAHGHPTGPDSSEPKEVVADVVVGGSWGDARARQPEWAAGYLAALAGCGHKDEAARAAGVTLRMVQKHRARSGDFASAEREALGLVLDKLESRMADLAINGTKKTKTNKDGSVTEWVEFDTFLQTRLAERLERGTWSQRQQIEHSVGATAFNTAAERAKALTEARTAMLEGGPGEGQVIDVPAEPPPEAPSGDNVTQEPE